MTRIRTARARRRTAALALVVAGTMLGLGVMRSTSGAVAATPATGTGTPHTAHTPGVSHARGAITSPGTHTGSTSHSASPTHSAGGTTTTTGGTGTRGVSHTPSTSHVRGATNSPGAAPGGTASGTPGTGVTQNTRYVQHLYTDLIGGQDPNGEAYWASRLDGGSSRSSVAYPLTQTDGYLSMLVTALYQKVMHRPVDGPGLAYWVGHLAQGLTPEALAASLAGSDEWFANPQFGNGSIDTFIAAVYQSLLGRPADAPGAAYWHDFLVGRGPRWQLTLDFAYSKEWAGQTVTRLFAQYHLGAPDPQGFAFWQGQIENGLRDDQLVAQLVSSDQYFAWAQAH